jgi:hypothetical protein
MTQRVTRRDGKIRHFLGGQMNGATADSGQDSRGVEAELFLILRAPSRH